MFGTLGVMDEHELRRVPLLTRSGGAHPARAGLTRLRHGVFASTEDLPSTEREAMHFARMQAATERMTRAAVFSHQSAAVLWGLPVVGRLTASVHLIAWNRVGFRTARGRIWHNDSIDDREVVEVDGMLVTSLLRTLLDLARSMPFASAVAALDRGVQDQIVTPLGTVQPGADRSELVDAAQGSVGARGIRGARRAVEFCDARSGSPGESVSRANMHELGFPRPDLQVRFPRGDLPGEDVVDFDWPSLGCFGEFDGRGKYIRPELTGGRSMDQVLWEEKLREDRIRRYRPTAVRWDWSVAIRPHLLARRLLEFGVRPLPAARPTVPSSVPSPRPHRPHRPHRPLRPGD